MAQYVFKRTEKKYIVTNEQYEQLRQRLDWHMKADEYGEYTICNIYFDTSDYELIRTSVQKPIFKEKLRLRSYGSPKADSTVFLEIKRKYKGVVYKRRVSLPYNEMMLYLKTGKHVGKDEQVFKEIDYFISYYNPEPKINLSYDRIAFKGIDDSSLRITFDSNIRFRKTELEMTNGDYGEKILEDDKKIMEIKSESAMPIWLCQTLNDLKIYPTSFSKYGNIYTNKILKNEVAAQCLQA